MGLDMYAWSVPKENALSDFEIKMDDEGCRVDAEELFYWRKHHDLHGWMEDLFYKKGGESDSFNCDYLRLTLEDLDQLEGDVVKYHLPHTEGFFFGDNPPDPESVSYDLEFIEKARDAIHNGLEVYYYSWW